ncbi:hypothetical protein Echvi_1838 [Echinicola vietnamensis DSM 17526]|uniref:Uncharacterized protein n=1 Tax=Echinicola vietnamensis (strain DSM 17526 / LMG 23754 / KMM 6221) TaxID=926556 RepID=L0FXT4_ECHVK|nr:hypothetical protein Echvi_1838 [Echinicola vietnamensis DSM 17526]
MPKHLILPLNYAKYRVFKGLRLNMQRDSQLPPLQLSTSHKTSF